jgi:hypothetical protein
MIFDGLCRTETPPRVRLDIDLWHCPSPTATGFGEQSSSAVLLESPSLVLATLAARSLRQARLFGRRTARCSVAASSNNLAMPGAQESLPETFRRVGECARKKGC